MRKRLNEDLAFVVSHVRFLDVFTDVAASRGGVEKTKIERRTGHRCEVTNERARASDDRCWVLWFRFVCTRVPMGLTVYYSRNEEKFWTFG